MESTIKKANANRKIFFVHFEVTVVPIYLSIQDKKNPQYKLKCLSMILDFNDTPSRYK